MSMKNLFLILCLSFSLIGMSQEKYFTKTGVVVFEASVPSFEAVKATHKNVTVLLNTESGALAALVLIKGFRFENALMEEHFNENYMESDTHSKANFKGRIEGFEMNAIGESKQPLVMVGAMTIRGISKEVSFDVHVSKLADFFFIDGMLIVNPTDFGIDIPGIVREKIAKNIKINLHLELQPRG